MHATQSADIPHIPLGNGMPKGYNQPSFFCRHSGQTPLTTYSASSTKNPSGMGTGGMGTAVRQVVLWHTVQERWMWPRCRRPSGQWHTQYFCIPEPSSMVWSSPFSAKSASERNTVDESAVPNNATTSCNEKVPSTPS